MYTGFSFTGRNATPTRPLDKPPAVNGSAWARDRSAPGAGDGTELDATWLNRLRANLEGLVIALEGDLALGDEQLPVAILSALARKQESFGLRLGLDLIDGGLELRSTDGSVQFRAGDRDGAKNFIFVEGNLAGGGPVIGTQGSDANIPFYFYAKGAGSHYFGNDRGVGLEVVDSGDASGLYDRWVQICGGNASVPARIKGTNDVWHDVPIGKEHVFSAGGLVMAKFRNILGASSVGAYITFSGDDTKARLSVEGAATTRNLYMQMGGNAGALTIMNGQGNLLSVVPASGWKNGLTIRPSAVGVAVELFANNGAFDGSGDASPPLRMSTRNGGNVQLWCYSAGAGFEVVDAGAAKFPALSAPPANAAAGWVYYDTALNKLRAFDGTTWNNFW